jgi:hypothetical protein
MLLGTSLSTISIPATTNLLDWQAPHDLDVVRSWYVSLRAGYLDSRKGSRADWVERYGTRFLGMELSSVGGMDKMPTKDYTLHVRNK